MPSINQKTLNSKTHFNGVGLHSGIKTKMTLIPAPPNHGIIFKRTDLKNNNLIDATFLNVKQALLCTTIENEFGISVSTIEHLLGALYGEGIDNLLVEIDSSELPIMDGSAKEFVDNIKKIGIKNYDTPKKYIKVQKKFEYREGEKFITIEPSDNELIIDFEIVYENALIKKQRKKVNLSKDNLEEIYNSRTFCLFEDIDKIKKMGLAKGGNLDNAVVIQDTKILNKDGLRYTNEFVKHKILDCMGDLMLSNYGIFGKIICSQGGHKLTNEFLRKFFLDKNNYTLVEFKESKIPNTSIYNKSLAATA